MARWTIYDKSGNVKAITNGITVGSRTMPELEYSGTWMGETFVTISVKSEQPVNWQIGDYLIYRGEKFVLNYDPSVVKKARRNTYGEGFVYDGIKFNSLNVEMSDVQFLDEVLSDNHIHYTSLPNFSFFAATIDDYADRLQANMNRYCLQNNFLLSEWWLILTPSRTRTVARGAGISGLSTRLGAAWDIAYQDEPSTDGEKFNQNVSISKSTVFAGLSNIYNLFGLHYVTSGRTLIIGAAGKIASHVFEYGKGNGLYEIERVADSEQQLVTKLYAYGNSTNLPIRYYSNIAKVCVGKVTGIQRTGNTQLSLDTDLPYQDSYFSNRTGDIIPRALVTIRSHVITIGGGVIKRDNNTVMVSIFLKTSPDDPDWYTTDSQGLATLIQQMQVGDELIFVEGADIDKWPAGHFSYGSSIPNNLAINNLMLPGFPTQSLKAWVVANSGTLNQDGTVTWNGHTAFFSDNELAPYILSPNSAALGVREASKTWDGSDDTEDIYPTIENTGDDILVSADIITDNGVFGEGEEVPNFSVIVKGLGDDVELDSLISNSGDAAKISMKDGYCGGREFSVVSAEKVSGSTNWKLTLKRDYDEALQLYFPYSNNASIGQTSVANEAYQLRGADIAGYDGDKFVWLGIDMPSEYIEASAEKLLDAALTFLEANDYARYTYSPKVDEIYMAKQHDAAIASQSSQNPFDSLHDTLHEGNLMQFDDEDLMIDGNIFIDKLTIKEYGNGAIPTYDVTLRNHKSVGTYQRLLNTVDSLSGKGGSGGSGVSTSQAKSLIHQEGDKRYIRRDINDETDTDITANKFIAKEGVKTDTIGGKSGTTLRVEDDLQVDGDASVGGDLSVAGDTELNGDVTIGNSASDEALIKAFAKVFQQIQSNNYSGDSPFDQGWMIKNAEVNHGNASYMVVDNLFVRMKAIFTELEIRKISYAGGNIVLSHAGSTLVKVVPLTTTMQPTVVDGKLTISGNLARVENNRLILDSGTVVGNRIILDGSQEVLYAYRCYIKKDDGTTATENWWRADDQARCQTFNIDETGTYHDVSNSFYWRRVMNVGSEIPVGETTDEVMDYVDLSALDCIAGSTVPQAGDVIVQMGNRTDVSRQGFISLEVYGDDAPAFKVYKNVNGYTLNNKMPIIISPYNTSIRARRLSIETDYDVQIVPMERGDWSLIPEHKCYYYDQVQHNGSTWLCIFPEEGSGGVKYTTEEPSLEANWWKVLAQAGRDGSDGKSFNILGSYDTMAEFIEAHPTGSVGDAYIVAGDLVVWDDENQQWSNSGRIQGETGNGISGATIHYGTSASNTTVPTNWTANYADLPYTQGEWIWTRVVLSYTDGTSANPYYTQARIGVDGSYKSTAFTRSNKQLSATTPTGGDYSNPLPNQQTVQGEVITWSDGIPAGEAIVWATSRVFTPTGASSGWSTPRQMTDTSSNDVEFSANATKPANPSDNESERDAQGWRDVTRNPSFDFTTAIWRAERTKQNGVWSAWVIEKIKGESITKTGEDVKYALSDSGTVAPQSGWQTTKPTSTDTMRWIWTRTIITWSDTSTTTLYQAERDPNDGVDGMEIVVGTQTIKYAVTDNGSSHPSEDSPLWQDTYTPVQGKWLWSKITTPYIYDGGGSAGTTVSYDVSYIAVDGAKGDKGDSVTVDTQNSKTQYVASNQGTSAPTSGWTTTIPSVPQGQFLWTKVTTVYSDGSSTVSYGVSYNAEDGADGADGTSVTITSKSVKYAITNNGTQPADSSFTYNSIPPLELGQYLWTKTEVVYSDGNSTKAYSVSRLGTDGEDGQTGADGYTTHFAYATSADGSQGFSTTNFNGATYIGTYRDQNATDSTNYRDYTWTEWKGDKGDKGDTGRGISRVDEYYLAGNSSTTPPTGTWVTNPNNAGWDATNKYLWNYENVVYTDGTSAPTTKSPVAIWSKDGKGIDSITNYYKASSNANEPRPAVDGTEGWTTSIQTISPDAIYLHNYEKITYSDGSTPYRSDSHIIGHWGMDALEASQLILSPSLIAIPTDTDGVVLEDFRQEIEVSMKTYSDVLSLKSVDFTANENVVVEASTLIAMSWSGASVQNGRLVNVEGSVNNGRLTISADDYAVVPSKIVVKATKGTTLTESTVSITATALDEDGNEYNGYNELTVQRQYIAEDGADGEDGEDAINVVLSPFAVLFSQDVSSDDDTAAHAIAQITPETIASQVVVTKGETPITTGVVVTVSSTSHFNTSGVTIEGTTITLDKDGIQVEEVDMKYYPYDNGYVDLNVAYNGENYPLRLQFYVNLMGKFKTTIEGDVETSIANKTWYEYNPATGQYDKATTMGEFIRSSSENTSILDEQINDPTTGLEHKYSEISQNVNNISLKVGQYYNLFYNAFFGELLAERSPYSPTTSISLVSEGTYGGKVIRMGGGYFNETMTSSIMGSDTKGYGVYLDKGTYTFQMYAKVQTSYSSTGFAGIELLWDDNADFSTWTPSKIIQRIQVTETYYSRYTYTFTLTSARYVGFRMILDGISIGGTSFNLSIDAVMLEIGSTASSMVSSYGGNQSGAEVGKVQRKLLATGIDIEDKKITMTADKFECQNNSGVKTAWLDDMGNFTVRGVYNNLITVINDSNWDRYIIKVGSGAYSKWYLDVLLCGTFVVIESLPSRVVDEFNSSTDGMLNLPYYANDNYFTRGYTRYLASSDSEPRLMTADELRMLAGRKFVIKWNAITGISNNRSIGYVFRPEVYYGSSTKTIDRLDNRLRDLYAGERHCISINPSDTSVNRSPVLYVPRTFFMSFNLVKFHTSQAESNYSWGYIWMADDDSGLASQDDINWT